MRFKDRVVIVTGGASGIGAAAVAAFAREGAATVIADMSEKAEQMAASMNGAGQPALFLKTDV